MTRSLDFLIEGVLLPIIGMIGIFGNISSIFYFSSGRRYRTNFHAFMLWLAVCDTVLIVSACTMYAFPEWSTAYAESGIPEYLTPWVLTIAQIALTGNIYFTIAISIERYIVICHPLFHRGQHSQKPSRYFVMSILLFAIVYNFSKFFELEAYVVPEQNEELEGIDRLTRMFMKNNNAGKYYGD